MRTWTAQTHVAADPEVVLAVLTDPDACRRWSPVPFDVDAAGADRLAAGTRMRVSGQLVGRTVGLDVEVHEAGDGRLALSAQGPVAFDVAYEARRVPKGGSEVCASVSVRSGGGLFGRVAEQATAALLHAGALGVAVDRIAASAAS
jgi:carbon monoxide dehydrogenase subunit G